MMDFTQIKPRLTEDSRLQALLNDYNMVGLGVYFLICAEIESSETKALPLDFLIKLCSNYARKNSITSVLNKYGLFSQDEFGLVRACACPACVSPAPASLACDNNKDIISKENNNIIIEENSFQKPTIDEISAYCQQRQNNIDAEYFFCYYEAKDWMIGKSKMKDWKAAIYFWERKSNEQKAAAKVATTNGNARQFVSKCQQQLIQDDYVPSRAVSIDCKPIPPDAPPKPSPYAQWDYATDSWNEFY